MRFLLLLILSFNGFSVNCQDINGIWSGKLTQEAGGCYPEYFIELQMKLTAQGIAGVTYDYYDTTKYVRLSFNGQLNESTQHLVIVEHSVTEYKIPKDCVPCVKTYELTYSRLNNEEVLTGTWKGLEMGSVKGCPPGKIFLKKVNVSAFRKESPAPRSPDKKTSKPEQRKTEIVKTIVLDTAGIKLELYDNGQIDGDTISIFLNDELIAYKKGLTDKPLVIHLPILADKDYEMMMFAENLGSIPPNTALMVVTSGTKKYELYLSSSEQKSAAVRFRYVKNAER